MNIKTGISSKWKAWNAELDERTCTPCRTRDGKIYRIDEDVTPEPPLHIHCRCVIDFLKTVLVGCATVNGKQGADWFLKYYNRLPGYYISKSDAYAAGWRAAKGNLAKVVPGKMIFGGVFNNFEGKLPHKYGRVWYEADINYTAGVRNAERILFSNDGLMFVTYDHYRSFIEVGN